MEEIVIPEWVGKLAFDIWNWAKPRWIELVAAAMAIIFMLGLKAWMAKHGGR